VAENILETGYNKCSANIITKEKGSKPARITITLQNPDNGLNVCFAS